MLYNTELKGLEFILPQRIPTEVLAEILVFSHFGCLSTLHVEIFIQTDYFSAQKASLLGLPTHATFVLDMRMAKTPETVTSFLQDLAVKLQPLKQEEMQLFLQYKKEDVSHEQSLKNCIIAVT